MFNSGGALARLGRFYAQAIIEAGIGFDMLFGPAYKGIPLVAATAIALAERHGRDVPWRFNRKENKNHGEAPVGCVPRIILLAGGDAGAPRVAQRLERVIAPRSIILYKTRIILHRVGHAQDLPQQPDVR